MRGADAGFAECPHCGKESEFVCHPTTAYVICSDHNCWGGMEVSWGAEDDSEVFISKMRRNWNKRAASNNTGLEAAIKSVQKLRERIHAENQVPYSEHDQLCVDVLDEALFKMSCFMP